MFTGRYLFHLHTPLTDGHITVQQYFDYAAREAVEQLIFLEHIRRQPNYSVEEFIAEIKTCVETFAIPARIGFEVKLLPNGNLDISEEHIEIAEVIGIAEHGFPPDFDLLTRSFYQSIDNYQSLIGSKE